ncbi:MAG: hypothetical protein UZ19_OD1000442 [Parcubacteria bacterium OLB19]|nr:MAG: hypothetical protein UZ19_OD1000442 [Parcubacteria bacterium OLB19]
MSRMGVWPIYVLLTLLLIMGGAFAYFTDKNNKLIAEEKQALAKAKLEESIKAGKKNFRFKCCYKYRF